MAKCPGPRIREVTLWNRMQPGATATDITSCGDALQANGCDESAQSGANHIKLPDALQWETQPSFPQGSADSCPLTGDSTAPGLYYVLIRWHPGYMSAPHTYTTDRYCIVVSGSWWINSGADFDPASCVPAPAGSFVHRVAGTPHYDGVIPARMSRQSSRSAVSVQSTSRSPIHRNPPGGPRDR